MLAGVNGKIAEKLGLINTNILQSKRKSQLKKLITFAPPSMAKKVRKHYSMPARGISANTANAALLSEGTATFKPGEGANPITGKIGERETGEEQRWKLSFQAHKEEVN